MDPLKYFAYFRYVPTKQEYEKFHTGKNLPKNISLVKNRAVDKTNYKYLKETLKKEKISRKKLNKYLWLIKFLGKSSWIKYIGISGTVSMNNATFEDDIDVFVITSHNRLWTARFYILVLTSLFGARRTFKSKDTKDKLCFNLFFCQSNLKIPKFKQTIYIAHEILQLKTIVNKNNVYEDFLYRNKWVFKKFPHAKKFYPIKKSTTQIKFQKNKLENLLGKIQLQSIYKRQTNEIIKENQLWFFPNDFEKKLPLN